jgi:hypothetical protein
VVPDWIEANDPKVQNRHLHDWWNVFQDATLNSLITTAYDQNLTLRVVGTRILQGRAQQAIAAGTIFPQTQQMTGSYTREGISYNATNNPGAVTTGTGAGGWHRRLSLMRRHLCIGAVLMILVAAARGRGGEPECCPPPQDSFLQRLHPVGGWAPYGGGLLHWWDPHCFPRCGGPDDYCRKPLPRVCWPPSYPPYYTWGLPESCSPHGKDTRSPQTP